MIDLIALTLSLLSLLDAEPVKPAPEAPVGTEFKTREDVRLPWEEKHRYFADGPHAVEMSDAIAIAAELDPPKALFDKRELPVKGRLPGGVPPELAALQRLEALLLPPSDRIQVLEEPGRQTKSLTATRANDAISFADAGTIPPDAEMAVGPNHVVVAVNSHLQVFSAANGQALSIVVPLKTLMGVATGSNPNCAGHLFDPNVIYDEQRNRFLVGMSTGSDYCLAVTQSGNPLGTWKTYAIAADIGGFFFDYPHIGIGRQAVYFASNQFFDDDGDGDLDYQEARLFALDKDRLYAGQSVSVVSWSLSTQGAAFSPQPLKLYGHNDGTLPTSGPDYVLSRPGGRYLTVWAIDDPLGAGNLTRKADLDVEDFIGIDTGAPVDPPQLDGQTLQAGDTRNLDFEYRNGYAWTVQAVGCNPGSGTVTCIRWTKLDPAANTLVDAGVFAIDGSYMIFPDIAVNRCEDVLVGFTRSDTSRYPSVWVAGRASDDPAGTFSFSQEQKAGTAAYFGTGSSGPFRYGDYTGATIAPDGVSLWYIGQRSVPAGGLSANWSTHFARYAFPDDDDDGVPNSCDTCAGSDDADDADDDTVPDGCDQCPGSDDSLDDDDDGVPDGCDMCIGDDASGNSDGDAYCDDIDLCAGSDDDLDADGDGVPDGCDVCIGDDASGNDDGDLYCNDIDICLLGDDDIDSDGDGIPDACDSCFGDNDLDADGDGVCDAEDVCIGDDASGNVDGDELCADLDCDDTDGTVTGPDRCDVCLGDGTSCTVLFPIGDPFQVTTTTSGNQSQPSVAAGDEGFLVTWSSSDGSGNGIRGRHFTPSGDANGDDFEINQTTAGGQQRSAVSTVGGSDDFIVAWQSANLDGSFLGIGGRFVDGGAVVGGATGSELTLNDADIGNQEAPALAPTADGFQAAWQGNRFNGGVSETIVGRRFLSSGAAATGDIGFTTTGDQFLPDLAAMPAGGAMLTWLDDESSVRVQLIDGTGVIVGDDVQVDNAGSSAAVAVDGDGRAFVTWAEDAGDSANNAAVFARRVDEDGEIDGPRRRVSPSADGDQEAPDVAALVDGGFVIVYEDAGTGDIRAQLYDADGVVGQSVEGALVGAEPFAVNTDTVAVGAAPAVAVDENGTFFVAWTDSRIDGDGTGIAGRFFGTDADADAIPGAADNCPLVANPDQNDEDGDGTGDACDACVTGDDDFDADNDGTPDGCDTCTDLDGDGAGDPGFPGNTCADDNCPADANPDQADTDNDGAGDACDTCTDTDGDGAGDPGFPANTCAEDNCPDDSNADQADADNDGLGDACDPCLGDNDSGDSDGDGVCADRDCNDGDPAVQTVDACGVCGGDNQCDLFSDDFELGDVSAWTVTVP